MATPRKTDPQDPGASPKRRQGRPLTPEERAQLEGYQRRFDAVHQPASERRGHVTNAELYASEKRLGEEFILRHIPAILQQQILVATGQAVEYLINHKTGEVIEIPVNPKTVIQAAKDLEERVWGKPETIKQITETSESKQTLTILIGPAADAYHAEQERIRGARVLEMPAPDEPLVLPAPPVEDLAALPLVFEDREIRKVMLDKVLEGADPYEVRAAVHGQFGTRAERRARRKRAEAGAG